MIACASSKIVISFGLPILTGSVTSDIINLLFASSDSLEDITAGTADVNKLTSIYEEFDKLLGSEDEPAAPQVVAEHPSIEASEA